VTAPRNRKARLFVARTLSIDPRPLLGPDIDVEVWEGELPPPRAELLARAAQADAMVTLLTEKVDAELLAQAPALKVVAKISGCGCSKVPANGTFVPNRSFG